MATRPTGSRRWPPSSTLSAAQVVETEDGLRITPKPLRGNRFRTYHDHRMADRGRCRRVCAVPGVVVEDIATTRKTLPDFPGLWDAMLAQGARGDARRSHGGHARLARVGGAP